MPQLGNGEVTRETREGALQLQLLLMLGRCHQSKPFGLQSLLVRYVFVIWLLWLFGYWRAEADTSLMKHSSSWNTWLWLISISTQSIKIQMSHSGTVCLAWIVVNTWCEEIKRNKSKMLCTRLVWGQLDPVEKTVVNLKLELRRIFRQ